MAAMMLHANFGGNSVVPFLGALTLPGSAAPESSETEALLADQVGHEELLESL
jgi:hypothetical protein